MLAAEVEHHLKSTLVVLQHLNVEFKTMMRLVTHGTIYGALIITPRRGDCLPLRKEVHTRLATCDMHCIQPMWQSLGNSSSEGSSSMLL
eukprot:6478729-Amphidinium_carterae.2